MRLYPYIPFLLLLNQSLHLLRVYIELAKSRIGLGSHISGPFEYHGGCDMYHGG
jgi:hypothetical protein